MIPRLHLYILFPISVNEASSASIASPAPGTLTSSHAKKAPTLGIASSSMPTLTPSQAEEYAGKEETGNGCPHETKRIAAQARCLVIGPEIISAFDVCGAIKQGVSRYCFQKEED